MRREFSSYPPRRHGAVAGRDVTLLYWFFRLAVGGSTMLRAAIVLFIIALVLALFGFGVVASAFADIAMILF